MEEERERHTHAHKRQTAGWREDGGKTERVVDGWQNREHNS